MEKERGGGEWGGVRLSWICHWLIVYFIQLNFPYTQLEMYMDTFFSLLIY